MATTLKDIARLAGVSHTTVSRALNDHPAISPETKERIVKLADELNYSSNMSAKSLVTNRSHTIGLFFSRTSQRTSPGFFYEMMGGVNDVLMGRYNLVAREIGMQTDFSTVDHNRFDGILFVSQSEQDDAFIRDMLCKQIPLVVLNRELDPGAAANVLPMDKRGAWLATRFLIENHHRDIAVVQGPPEYRSSQTRLLGYQKAMEEAGLVIPEAYLTYGAYTIESGYAAMQRLLALKKRPTAVFAFNDDMAVGVMRAVAEAGLSVPGDISVVGFDGNVECDYVTPPLTTVDKRSREVSAKGTELLLDLIQGKGDDRAKVYVEPALLVKDSVRPLAQIAQAPDAPAGKGPKGTPLKKTKHVKKEI